MNTPLEDNSVIKYRQEDGYKPCFRLWKFINFIMNKRLKGGQCISFLNCGTKVPHV